MVIHLVVISIINSTIVLLGTCRQLIVWSIEPR